MVTAIYMFWALGICISRSYLGMHAYNQVILGGIYGIYICSMLINYIDPITDKFLVKIMTKDFENIPLLLWTLGLIYIIASFIPVIIYIASDISNPVNYSIVWN